jgi:hypothetical protein
MVELDGVFTSGLKVDSQVDDAIGASPKDLSLLQRGSIGVELAQALDSVVTSGLQVDRQVDVALGGGSKDVSQLESALKHAAKPGLRGERNTSGLKVSRGSKDPDGRFQGCGSVQRHPGFGERYSLIVHPYQHIDHAQ